MEGWIILAFIGGLILGFGIMWIERIPTPQPRETYGHPFSTFEEVKRRLPKAPEGYLWEHLIDRASDGAVWQHLRLMRVSDSKTVASKKVDLTWQHFSGVSGRYRPHSELYNGNFSRFRSLRVEHCNKHIVNPLLSWAQQTAVKYAGASAEPFEYDVTV